MKNLLFVTVGTSGISNVQLGTAPDGKHDNGALQSKMNLFRKDSLKLDDDLALFFDDLVAAHRVFWEQPDSYTDNPQNFLQSSAELTSTACLVRALGRKSPLRIDEVILLASDTRDGLFAARVVQTVMKSQAYKVGVPKDAIISHEIPGPEGDWMRLPDVLMNAVAEHRNSEKDRCYFNITGGFKGVAAMIGMLAGRKGFRLYYQHETLRTPVFVSEELRMARTPDVWKV